MKKEAQSRGVGSRAWRRKGALPCPPSKGKSKGNPGQRLLRKYHVIE